MSNTTIEQIPGSEPAAVAVPASDEQLVAMLVDRARSVLRADRVRELETPADPWEHGRGALNPEK